jgi:hypothetical protein
VNLAYAKVNVREVTDCLAKCHRIDISKNELCKYCLRGLQRPGDFQESLPCLKKSLALSPRTGIGAPLSWCLPPEHAKDHLRNPRLLANFGMGASVLFAMVGCFTYANFYLAAAPFHLNST